jgi:hypothetical protein
VAQFYSGQIQSSGALSLRRLVRFCPALTQILVQDNGLLR